MAKLSVKSADNKCSNSLKRRSSTDEQIEMYRAEKISERSKKVHLIICAKTKLPCNEEKKVHVLWIRPFLLATNNI